MSLFLDNYVAFHAAATDSPLEFAEAAGLAALSAVAMRYRWIENGIQPNIFIVCTGPSTRDHKSTAVNLSTEVVMDVVPERIGPTDFTPEALTMYMAKKYGDNDETFNTLFLGIGEFGMILAMMQRSFGAGLAATLCDLYDGKSITRVRATSKPVKVDKPLVTILGGCAYRMLDLYTTAEDWGSGFFARMCFVTGTRRPRYVVQPTLDPSKRAVAFASLTSILFRVRMGGKALAITPAALQLYECALKQEPFSKLGADLDLAGYRERLYTTILKFALLYQIDIDPDADIGVDAMENALRFGQIAWRSGAAIWAICAKSKDRRALRDLTDRIAKIGGSISRRELLRLSHLKVKDFDELTATLLAAGAIESYTEKKSRMFKLVNPLFDEDD